MSIQILPARLANQIAAGEVVERPASVIKELVENSLDAGATRLHIEIEKGGAKTIKVTDNGSGIVKDELTLALSRHATSKIHDLSDLEAITSLGFRGEALASISSVARLTLTSRPAEQENAWQAYAQGRDMEVVVKPAAHPIGTTIEVRDLFFNTPARRKFLRTEKTEFTHIDEVIRRIALAKFNVSFTLTHNGKVVRQYRAVNNKEQYIKRIGQICGQAFVEQAIEVECQHGDMQLWGWIANSSYHRVANDLCYSYVNGRMMRDKLINHAIRQAFADRLPLNTYPAFVLFVELDHKEVDVNVHPAKHEVRFHQSRYVHDFIYTVCHQALEDNVQIQPSLSQPQPEPAEEVSFEAQVAQQLSPTHTGTVTARESSYVKPLQHVREPSSYQANHVASSNAADVYQQLMTPYQQTSVTANEIHLAEDEIQLLHIVEQRFALIVLNGKLQLLSLTKLCQLIESTRLQQQWHTGLVSQPLLLPIAMSLSKEQQGCFNDNIDLLQQAGIVAHTLGGGKLQIRQYPAILRNESVSDSFLNIIDGLFQLTETATDNDLIGLISLQLAQRDFTLATAEVLMQQASTTFQQEKISKIALNSIDVDLTSLLNQF